MNKYEEFESFLIKNSYRYNPFDFNSNMMYRAKIFNQYSKYYRDEKGADNYEYNALQRDVNEFERKLMKNRT